MLLKRQARVWYWLGHWRWERARQRSLLGWGQGRTHRHRGSLGFVQSWVCEGRGDGRGLMPNFAELEHVFGETQTWGVEV